MTDQSDDAPTRFLSLSRDMLCVVGFDGYLRSVNPATERALGYPQSELPGRHILEFVHPDDRDVVTSGLERVVAGESLENLQVRLVSEDGTLHYSEWSAQPDTDADILYALGQDITERKQTEERQTFLLGLSDALRPLDDPVRIQQIAMRLLGEHLGVVRASYFEMDADQDGSTQATGYETGSVRLPRSMRISDYGPEIEAAYRAGQTVIFSDTETDPRVEAQRPAYRALCVRAWVGVPLVKHGQLRGVVGVQHDKQRNWTSAEVQLLEETAERTWTAVERAKAEELLHKSEERLRKAFSIETVGVLFFNLDGRITGANRAFERMSGYSREELLKMVHWEVMTPPEFMGVTTRAAEELATRGETAPYEKQLIRKDGSRWWVLSAYTRISGSGSGSECVKFAIDITERKQAEEALRESEGRYRTLFESIDEGFCIVEVLFDENGRAYDYRFLEANPAFERQTGLVNAIGRTIREFSPNHEQHWFEIYGDIALTGIPARFQDPAMELGRFYDVYAFRVGAPEERRVAILFNDISERKRTEEERERVRREAEEAVRARDQFVSIASHELRNPVASIKATAQLMRRAVGRGELDKPKTERYTRAIVDSSEYLSVLIDDLLDVSRLQSGQLPLYKQPTDLAELVRSAVEIERVSGQRHQLRLDIEDGHILQLDPERIRQIVVNLLDNSIKYSPEGSEVRIVLTYDADGALLKVTDRGIGLANEALESIFEPFGRASNATASSIHGMGLGLFICRRIALAHGGRLWAESEGEGRGTTMSLRLPLADGESSESQASSAGGR